MEGFTEFLFESEEKDNIKELLSKLPKGHQKLVNNYKILFQGGNTLKGDNKHIGLVHKDKITIAAPWRYSREMTFLHELSHIVYEYLMTPELKKEWSKLVKATKNQHKKSIKPQSRDALDQNDEEIFAMSYGAAYAKHPPTTFNHPKWINFIKNKVPKD